MKPIITDRGQALAELMVLISEIHGCGGMAEIVEVPATIAMAHRTGSAIEEIMSSEAGDRRWDQVDWTRLLAVQEVGPEALLAFMENPDQQLLVRRVLDPGSHVRAPYDASRYQDDRDWIIEEGKVNRPPPVPYQAELKIDFSFHGTMLVPVGIDPRSGEEDLEKACREALKEQGQFAYLAHRQVMLNLCSFSAEFDRLLPAKEKS